MLRSAALPLVMTALIACQPAEEAAPPAPQDAFWSSLEALCGSAYEGSVINPQPGDTAFAGKRLVMHVRSCSPEVMHIAFNVGDDLSRTWVLSRTDDGLRLKHDHRHEDGSEDQITQYGGDTRDSGEPTRQDFYADDHTASLIPAASTNIWTVEVPEGQYVYGLRREGTDRRFRVEFDTTVPVEAPPPSWGHEDAY